MKKLCKCGCGQEVKEGNDYIHGHNRQGRASYTSGDRWAIGYDACIACGTTEIPHNGKGLCKKCYRKKQYYDKKEGSSNWARAYKKCVQCGKTEMPHRAKGLCTRCYDKLRNAQQGKKVRNFGAWSWYYDKCKECGTVFIEHVSNGLCKDCYDQSKRDLSDCVECPVCGVMVTKLNQHITMKSKRCKKHYNYQYNLYKKYFDSDLNLDDIADEIGSGTERHSVSYQFTRFFGKEKTKERNENVRRCNISEKAVINYNSNNRFGTVVEYDSPNQGRIKFRSKLEAEYAEFLDSTNTNWLYESQSFPYLDKEGKRRTYTPDFYLPDEDKFIEVKGYEDDDSAEYKVACVVSNNINIEIIRQEEIKGLKND